MKRLSPAYCLAAVMTLVAVPLEARPVVQSSPKQAASQAAVLGQWRGLMESTPAVDLTIKQADGALTGTVVFFRIESDSDGNPKVVGQDEVPLQDLRVEVGRPVVWRPARSGDDALHHAAFGVRECGPQARRCAA